MRAGRSLVLVLVLRKLNEYRFFSLIATNIWAHHRAANSTNSTNQGVSPLDIAALNADSLTAANTPTTANTLGLDIEYVTMSMSQSDLNISIF